MFRSYFRLFLLGHVLGDFYFQTDKMACKKESSLIWLLFHGLCYELSLLLVIAPIMSYDLLIPIIMLGVCHLLIDIVKYIVLRIIRKRNRYTDITGRNIFIADQSIHIIFLVIMAYLVNDTEITEWKIIKDFFDTAGKSEGTTISWLLALLLVHKPANIAIQKLLIKYKPDKKDDDNEENKEDKNAGRFIGSLERLIMLIFLSIKQYSAIGLVLTAKSIARYDRIARDKNFAEYYLLGTLLSTLIVVVTSFLVK